MVLLWSGCANAAQNGFELTGGGARLGGVGLVGDHGIATAGQGGVFIQGIEQGRKGLDGDDDDPGLGR